MPKLIVSTATSITSNFAAVPLQKVIEHFYPSSQDILYYAPSCLTILILHSNKEKSLYMKHYLELKFNPAARIYIIAHSSIDPKTNFKYRYTLFCVTKPSNIATSNKAIYYECNHHGLRATIRCSNMIMSLQVPMKKEAFRPIMALLIMYACMKLTVHILNTYLILKNISIPIIKFYGRIQIYSKLKFQPSSTPIANSF